MKRILLIVLASALFLNSGTTSAKDKYGWLKNAIETAETQVCSMAGKYLDEEKLPISTRTWYSEKDRAWQMGVEYDPAARPEKPFREEHIFLNEPRDWRSGFYPGTLWLIYAITGNQDCAEYAKIYTNKLESLRTERGTHDLGFMVNCSYGNAELLAPADSLKPFLIQVADNLCSRFNPEVGCIQSWNRNERWNYPVIIDNMMNLDLLFHAYKLSGDEKYIDIAVKHADKTIANHFRDDFTSYHVVSYNDDGSVQMKCTHQGRSDDSAWARGQSWGLYGYTRCYAELGDEKYLDQAVNIARMMMMKVKTKDRIPYWDYCAPKSDKTPRDASAAAVAASAMVELSTVAPHGRKYLKYAERILKSLASAQYLAEPGTNFDFITKHSVTNMGNASEVDACLNYADYYFVEAMQRYMAVKGINYNEL